VPHTTHLNVEAQKLQVKSG